VDGDYRSVVISEAATYLINKYGGDKKELLYPECPEVRARVNQRIDFDMGPFYSAFEDCTVSNTHDFRGVWRLGALNIPLLKFLL
jgi:hypothetical protein